MYTYVRVRSHGNWESHLDKTNFQHIARPEIEVYNYRIQNTKTHVIITTFMLSSVNLHSYRR